MTGVGRLFHRPRVRALPPTEPCERCGAVEWRTERAGLWSGTLSWLGRGGHWRPERAVCRRCGLKAGSGGWAMMLVGGAPRRWTLPLRVVRTLLQTVASERRAEPVPWLYLASGALGGVVGASAGAFDGLGRHPAYSNRRVAARTLPRSRRRMSGGDHDRRFGRAGLAGVVGAAAGMLACWSVFASTALRRRATWVKLRLAALDQVAPGQAYERRRRWDARRARSASFPVYGLERWPGARRIAGYGSEGAEELLTSVALEHGHRTDESGAWVLVETALDREPDERGIEEMLAEDLWHLTWQPPPSTGDPVADQRAQMAAHTRARADRPEAEWREGSLVVEGRSVPARWLADGAHWVAHATIDGLRVSLQAHALALDEVRLAVADLDSYTPFG